MNSNAKGKRGELAWRDELRKHGYQARRGQQFSGSPDSPDVVCECLPWAHFEVKHVQNLAVHKAMAQAVKDAGIDKHPFVAHKKNGTRWLVTMPSEVFFTLVKNQKTL